MTTRRFCGWVTFWVVGWALLLWNPRGLRWVGYMLALGIAPWFMITRDQFGKKVTKGQIVLLAGLAVILVLAIAVPSLFHVKWSNDSLSARVAYAVTAVLGIAINARRTFGRVNRRAA
jgi:hypothetical protein